MFPERLRNDQEKTVKSIEEPPSYTANTVIIGRNSRGNWVAQELNGLFGGLFVNRAQAMKYALFENGHHPETIVLTADIIELDMHHRVTVLPETIGSIAIVRKAA